MVAKAGRWEPARNTIVVLIVDTFNVLHCTGVLPPRLAGLGVPDLVRLISVSRYAGRAITLVCDGGSGGGVSGVRMDSFRILFSGAGREADDLIEHLIERYHRGNALDVVSSDRRLRRAARRRRAGSITSEAFLAALVDDERKPIEKRGNALRGQVPLDRFSVEQWMGEFGVPFVAGKNEGPTPLPAARPDPPPPVRPGPRALLGEALRIPMPANPPATPPSGPPEPAAESPAAPAVHPEPAGDPAVLIQGVDPLLLGALEEWRDRLRVDDLDMQRWAPDASPLRRER